MADKQTYRLISLARIFNRPLLATVITMMGSGSCYAISHQVLNLATPLSQGVYVAVAIAGIIAYPFFSLVAAQNRYIRKQYRQLEELNEQKNVMFSIIAHDMRSPLAQLKQTLDYAKDDETYAREVVTDFPDITRRVGNALGLVDKLISWSRASFQTGNVASDDMVPLRGLVDDLTEQLCEALHEKKLLLDNHVQVYCAPSSQTDLLKMVLRNLIGNAIKYTPDHGRIDIDCQIEAGQLCLSVSDTGVGIEHKTLDKLFGSERINTQPGTRGETGSGIGLLLCKQLLHSIGGSIGAESQVGVGSRFHIYLPLPA